MGRVYRAYDLTLERMVAIKLLNASLLGDVEDRARFKSEGRVLAQVNNKNVVQFYQYGVFEDRLPYMVMEYVKGASLRAVLDERKRLDAATAIDFALQICDGLSVVHALDVVHRDLKPTNILVTNTGEKVQIKLLDFGLSRILSSSPVAITQHLTKTGLLVGSVHYMSPEQCMGRKVDQRSDIYALGCVIYEMLCGELPFAADSPLGMLAKHVSEQPRTLDDFTQKIDLPVGITKVIDKAMQKKPEDRYCTIEELKQDLTLVRDRKGSRVSVKAKSPPIRNSTSSKSIVTSKKLVVFGVVSLVALLGILMAVPWELWASRREIDPVLPVQQVSQTTSRFDTERSTQVSGRVFFVESYRSDPTILSRLLIAPGDESPVLNLRCKDKIRTPIQLCQNVKCTIDGNSILQSVSIVENEEDGVVGAIKTLDEFMGLMQENKWSEAALLVDPLANAEAMSEHVLQRYWRKGVPRERSNDPYLRESYNGYSPERYRVLEANSECVVVLVNNSELFTNVYRLDRFFLNRRGPNWRVGRIQTNIEEPPPRVFK